MSAAATLLALLFGFLGFLTSLFGIFALLLGVVLFFVLPVIPKASRRFKRLANFYLWLMAGILGRAAFVVSAHNDLLLKRMRFDDRSVELVSFDDTEKAFEDPDQARHYFYGIPFALADEVHGLLFDPRHAAIGKAKHENERDGPMVVQATESERNTYSGAGNDILGWIRGVFELPKDTHQVLDLSYARELVTGIEKAEHPETIETFVEYSRAPYKSGTSASRIFIIIVAIVGPFLALGFLANQLGSAAGGPSSSIGWGSGLLWLLLSTHTLVDRDNLRDVAKAVIPPLVALLVLGLVTVGLILVAGLLTTIYLYASIALGFVLLLGLFRVLGAKAFPEAGGRLLLKLGLMGYDKPVFMWTQDKYELREYRDIDSDIEPYWYGIAGSLIGFSYEPGSKSFESAHIPNDDLETRKEVRADGGSSTNIPAGYTRFPEQRRASYAGFIPSSIDDDSFYVDTGIALSAFTHAAVGLKSHKFLVRAKREYGGEGGISDRTFVYATFAAGLISFIAGVLVFYVL